jgi:hypothetical protein
LETQDKTSQLSDFKLKAQKKKVNSRLLVIISSISKIKLKKKPFFFVLKSIKLLLNIGKLPKILNVEKI